MPRGPLVSGHPMTFALAKDAPFARTVRGKFVALEKFLQHWGFRILALSAAFYYGSYYDTGLTLTGERGSNVLIAMRILAGERPFVDFFPGYNLLWFYPMTGIYAVIGPHWLATRIYFLILAIVTCLMGYALVRRVTGQAWLAFIAGIFLLLMPGAIFRNYMGFIGVLASTLLVRAYVLEAGSQKKQVAWMVAAGAGLSLCFLIRVEPSLLVAVVWAGLVVLYPFAWPGDFLFRLRTVVLGTSAGLLAFAAVHAPFVADSYHRGFGPEFTGQYTRYIGLFRWELNREWEAWTSTDQTAIRSTATAKASGDEPDRARSASDQAHAETSGRDGRRAIPPVSEIFSGRGIYFFAAALWMPVPVAAVLVLSGAVLLVVSLIRANHSDKMRSLVVLTTTGCALSLFPQYFFFRPDSVHLNEFMVAFWPASLCSAWVLMRSAGESRLAVVRVWSWIVAALVALMFVVSFNGLFGRDGSGSIMDARGADSPFKALNGVQAKVEESELADWEGLRDAVGRHSAPGEFVVTYPYVPIVNVMCDRPTYQWSLYVDNATASAAFQEKEGAILRERRPAVIVVNNRAINKTEQSRFSNWADRLHAQIREDYDLVGRYFKKVEVFALREKGKEGRPAGDLDR